MVKRRRIALVGAGHISKKHISAINTLESKLDHVAICENNLEISSQLSLSKDVALFHDYTEMINNCDIDIVSLCTPSGLHPEQTVQAANKKINVITEKPMAINLKDAKKMIQACENNNVKLFIVKQNRFNPAIQLLKKSVDLKRFGNIILSSLNVFWTRPQEYYDSADWRGTRKFDGGALMNQASHYVDLLEWMIGPVESINASIATIARDIEAEDTSIINLRLGKNSLGSIAMTVLTYPKNLEGSITILGEKGTVKIGGQYMDKIIYCDIKDYVLPDIDLDIKCNDYGDYQGSASNHDKMIDHVSKTLLGLTKEQKTLDFSDGIGVVNIIERIYSLRN
mgnify:CR=1 FL=1